MDEFKRETYNKLWILISHTRDAILRARRKEIGQYGIRNIRQTGVLYLMNAIGEKATPAEISRWMFREAHTVSGIIDRMVKDGLIKKHKDLERKNMVRVSMTKKGKEVFELSNKREVLFNIFDALTEEQQEQLRSLLEIVFTNALEKADEDRPRYP